ncbi:MAG: Uma2 family endonuclease [Acidimicrobiales bacterium]
MSTTATGVRVEEFLTAGAFPREAELIHGEVVMIDATFEHQQVSGLVYAALLAWTRGGADRGRAGFGGNWAIARASVVKPDVWWTTQGRTPTGARTDQPPDLAVEVRSPGNWAYDIGPKRTIYEAAGVSELWLVDTPAKAILVNRRSTPDTPTFDVTLEVPTEETLTTPLLPGFELDLTALFA